MSDPRITQPERLVESLTSVRQMFSGAACGYNAEKVARNLCWYLRDFEDLETSEQGSSTEEVEGIIKFLDDLATYMAYVEDLD